jgi:hypothetical protein
MRIAIASVAFVALVNVAKSAADYSATLRLAPQYWENGTLALNATVELRWMQESPLVVQGWKGGDGPIAVAADIDVIDESGISVAKLTTTGPAPVFQTSTTVVTGATRKFLVTTSCFFAVSRSGSYCATGRLRGTSTRGKPVVIDLGKVRFRVNTDIRIKPNQLPDPTSPSVTPPAGAGGAPSVAADH